MKIFLMLLISTILYSQEKQLNVIYKTTITNESIENNDKFKSTIFEGVDEAIKSLRFNLYTNNTLAIFSYEDKLYENKKTLRLARTFTGSEDFYINLNDTIQHKKIGFLGKDYYVSFVNNLKWEITDETKKIDSLICLKAKTTIKKEAKNKFKTIDITAWFCPNIPFQSGPKNFNGLPGLIIELQEENVTFIVEKIEFISENFKDLTYKEYQNTITEFEFKEIVQKKLNDLTDEFKIKD